MRDDDLRLVDACAHPRWVEFTGQAGWFHFRPGRYSMPMEFCEQCHLVRLAEDSMEEYERYAAQLSANVFGAVPDETPDAHVVTVDERSRLDEIDRIIADFVATDSGGS